MTISRHDSGNLNDVRAYPFADSASRRTADGVALPESILNDCHIWWPDTYGTRGFVSTLTVSPSLLTLTICAADQSENITAIAAVAIPRPYVPYKSYAVNALQTGVGGWVAPGNIPEELTGVHTWRFESSADGELLNRIAHAYPLYPVSSLTKEGLSGLTGRIRLSAGPNLSIEEGYRYIEGELQRCIVFGLDPKRLPSLYETFAGPCGKRPESNNCPRTPIRQINDVEPDCQGRIFVEVDDANGVLSGYADITDDAAGQGLILATPIEYADVCATSTFPVMYADECELLSSSSAVLEEVSSSSAVAQQSSSSAAAQVVAYDFAEVAQLNDWLLFEHESDEYRQDWQRENSAYSADMRLRLSNGLYVQVGDETAHRMRMLNNAWKTSFTAPGDSVELYARWTFTTAELAGLSSSDDDDVRYVDLRVVNEYMSSTSVRGFRARVTFKHYDPTPSYLHVDIDIQRRNLVIDSWTTVANGSVDTLFSSNPTTAELTFRVTLASTGPDTFDLEADYNGTVVTTSYSPADTSFRATFLGLGVQAGDTATVPLDEVTFVFTNLELRGSQLEQQTCDEADFVAAATGDNYALEYTPDTGWSNDFGITRALQQFELRPNSTYFDSVGVVLSGTYLTYPDQYLTLGSDTDHKYALLRCEDAVVGYTFSVALRRESGSPKAGLVLGYQDATSREPFWAFVIDFSTRRLAYGQHYTVGSGHYFNPAGWVLIPGSSADDWHNDWHRLVAKVTFSGGQFGLSCWVDPAEFSTSSSSLNLTKTIPINYASPTYSIIRSMWSGNFQFGALQFMDGRAGVYAYGGVVKAAEFTVSPVDQDIAVPRKLSWLPV